MRRALLALIACLLLPWTVLPQAEKVSVEVAGWLGGCWQREARGRLVTEHWMKPAGGAMLGMSRTVSNNKMTEYEFLQIRQQDDGEVYYIAKPSGQPEASFKLIKSGPHELIFANPQHDFPQRIIYRLEGESSLKARIEGSVNGKERGIDFPYSRIRCD